MKTMILCYECFCSARNTSLLLSINKIRKSKYVPFRYIFKWDSLKFKDSKSNKSAEEPEIERLFGPDDENFSKLLRKRFFDLKIQKEGFRNLMSECKRFYNEEFGNLKFSDIGNYQIEDERTKIHILHKFETEEDLKGFSVQTDSSYLKGYSSASLKLTENGTAIFSGNLCTDIPKTGNVAFAGYANLQFPKQRRAFFRYKCYDWSLYTHLVLKIRGDGRSYLTVLHLPNEYTETRYFQYGLLLYTRGGPYWQIVKLPFSYFYHMRKGRAHDHQNNRILLDNVVNMSFTVGGYAGPFKLEIDYIGLECKEFHKSISPYEQYK